MSKLQRIDSVTGSRVRTHAFMEAMQGQTAVTISHGKFGDMDGRGFSARLRAYVLVNAEVHTVPEKGGIFAWSEEPIITFAKDKSGVNKDATAEAVYYDDKYGGGLAKPKIRLLESTPYIPGGGFRSEVTGHVTAGTIILDGEDPLATIGVDDFPRDCAEYDASEVEDVRRFTLTTSGAGVLLAQLQGNRHPIVPAFVKSLNAVL